MSPSLARVLSVSLALLLAACTLSTPSPSPEPTPTPAALPTPSPAATPTPGPSPTLSPSPSPSPTLTRSPSPSPTLTPSPTPAATQAELLADELQEALDAQLARRRIPGAAAVISFPDGSRWSGVSGFASLNDELPVTPDTRFVVGSISKTFVAALVLQLAEEGVLDLDAPLAEWLPNYPRARRITLRQLLNHTSGVFNYFEHPLYESLVFGRPGHQWTPPEILSQFEREPYFRSGNGFHYSNTGFILLGLVIEEATGSSLGDELRRRFFEPLELNETYFQGNGPEPDAAHGYLRTTSGHRRVSGESDYRPTTSAASVAWAAGGIVSSASDISRWLEALYGGAVLNPESRAQMTDYSYSRHTRGTYGLGTRTRVVQGARAFGHTGSLRGYMAAAWYFPAERLSVVVLTNLGRFDGNRLADALATVVMPGAPDEPPGTPEAAEPEQTYEP